MWHFWLLDSLYPSLRARFFGWIDQFSWTTYKGFCTHGNGSAPIAERLSQHRSHALGARPIRYDAGIRHRPGHQTVQPGYQYVVSQVHRGEGLLESPLVPVNPGRGRRRRVWGKRRSPAGFDSALWDPS